MIFCTSGREPANAVTVETLTAQGGFASGFAADETAAMRLSAVSRSIELLSDSMGKLPFYGFDKNTRKRVDLPVLQLLTVRPNEAQTPFACKKMVEANRLCGGNGYLWIVRDSFTMQPRELVPIPKSMVVPVLTEGVVWYQIVHPMTGDVFTVNRADMIHVMGYTRNGYTGISVLERAAEVIGAGRAAQQYNLSYYENGGQPAGILQTDSDLSGSVEVQDASGSPVMVTKKDLIRTEWEKRHSGPTNAQRIAILDYGLKYSPITISNRDAQFVEQSEISVQDVARFFGVPLYKLQAGKQSYSSNEQNAIEYVVGTLHPNVSNWEEEFTWKLLLGRDVRAGLELRMNMMAELRGDFTTRGGWYEKMRNIGVFSVNDVRALEDLDDVEGGDERRESLNYVPLSDWKQLSRNRNNQGG